MCVAVDIVISNKKHLSNTFQSCSLLYARTKSKIAKTNAILAVVISLNSKGKIKLSAFIQIYFS